VEIGAMTRALSKLGLLLISIGGLVVAMWPRLAVFLADLGELLTHWALHIEVAR
jgi:hypothetical protein